MLIIHHLRLEYSSKQNRCKRGHSHTKQVDYERRSCIFRAIVRIIRVFFSDNLEARQLRCGSIDKMAIPPAGEEHSQHRCDLVHFLEICFRGVVPL